MIAWLSLSLAICAVTSIAIWSRRPTKARGLAVIAMLAVIPLSGVLLLSQRGWSSPLVPYLTNLPKGEMTVHGVHMIPEVAIYIWLQIEGEPRAFVLPWDADTASNLQRLMEKGEGIKAKAKKRTGLADDDIPLEFGGAPQRPQPQKQPEQAFQYERSE